MLKKTLLIICLSWLMLCFFQLNVSASDSLSDELWKWTYSHKPHRSFRPPDTRTRIYLTYISDEILDAWSKEETETIKKRISTLRKTIKEKKIALYLMRIDKYFPGYHDAIDLRNLKQQIYLQITEATNKKYYPVAVSQNLVNFLKTKQNYYGFIAFKQVEDEFSFQTITFKYNYIRFLKFFGDKEITEEKNEVNLQFSYLPNGAPEIHRNQPYSSSDILGILRVAFFIISKIARI